MGLLSYQAELTATIAATAPQGWMHPPPPLTLLALLHVVGFAQCLTLHALPLDAQAWEAREAAIGDIVVEEVVHHRGGDDVTDVLHVTA